MNEQNSQQEYDPSDGVLLKYQREWVHDESTIKAIAKSRQIGITWASAFEAVSVASRRPSAGGMDVHFMSATTDDARQFIDYCGEWVRGLAQVLHETPLVPEHRREETRPKPRVAGPGESQAEVEADDEAPPRYRLDFPSGHTIYAVPSQPAWLRGKKGFGIIDGAEQQDVAAILSAASGLLVWGGRLALIYNGVVKCMPEVKAYEVSLHEIFIHQALRDGLYRRICEGNGAEWSEACEAEWVERLRTSVGPKQFAEEFEGHHANV